MSLVALTIEFPVRCPHTTDKIVLVLYLTVMSNAVTSVFKTMKE